jgi:hypothetical protein
MATIKKATKAKNLSAGPSKKTPKAGPVDPKGKWTGIQERTLGNMKKGGVVKKAQGGDTLRTKDLDALAHQKRGMGTIDRSFVKKSDAVKNELGYLTDYQMKQLKEHMGKTGTAKKIYEGLPNVGRMVGKSAADIPEDSKLKQQKKGGIVKKKMKSGGSVAKDGKWIQKAIKKPGALRAQLGAKPGKPIAAGKLAAAAKKPGKLGQRARLAVTLGKMRKK